jgi:hypothetical protein
VAAVDPVPAVDPPAVVPHAVKPPGRDPAHAPAANLLPAAQGVPALSVEAAPVPSIHPPLAADGRAPAPVIDHTPAPDTTQAPARTVDAAPMPDAAPPPDTTPAPLVAPAPTARLALGPVPAARGTDAPSPAASATRPTPTTADSASTSGATQMTAGPRPADTDDTSPPPMLAAAPGTTIADAVTPAVTERASASSAPASRSAAAQAPSASVAASTASPTAANLANVVAGLHAFHLTSANFVAYISSFGPTAARLGPAARDAAAAQKHSSEATPAERGGGTTPHAPFGPSPSTAGTGVAAASSGPSSGLWCVLFLILLAPIGQELRRRRVRPVLAGPVGVVSLLQRPG